MVTQMQRGAQGFFPEDSVDSILYQLVTEPLIVQRMHLVLGIEGVRQGYGATLFAAAAMSRDIDGIADEIICHPFPVMRQKIQSVIIEYAFCSMIQNLAVWMQEQDGSS